MFLFKNRNSRWNWILSVNIDNTLTFKFHIHAIANRLRNFTYIFKSIKHKGDCATLKKVYHALRDSIIRYCNVSWNGTAKTILVQLERDQSGILKVAVFLPFIQYWIAQNMEATYCQANLSITSYLRSI